MPHCQCLQLSRFRLMRTCEFVQQGCRALVRCSALRVYTVCRRGLVEWSLSGPTYFAPVIRRAADMARETVNAGGAPKYTVLLIMTDGWVTGRRTNARG